MKNLLCFLSAIFLLAAGAHAVTTGQYEVRVYNGNSFTPSYLTLSDGQALGQNGGVPAAVSMTSGLTVGSTSVSGTGSGDLLKSDGTSLQKLTPGTGVSAALANAVNGSGGLLTYGIIGTSGAAVPLLNAANTWIANQSLTNSTAASNGSQQASPTLTLSGQGWETNTSASQTVLWTQVAQPVQGTSNPSVQWQLKANVNGSPSALPAIVAQSNGPVILNGVGGIGNANVLTLRHPDAYTGDIASIALGGAGNMEICQTMAIYPGQGIMSHQFGNGAYGLWLYGDDLWSYLKSTQNVIWIQNGTSAQKFFVTNTYTSATNWEAGVFDWQTTGNTLLIGSQVGSGGGTVRDVQLVRGGATKITVGANTTTHAQPVKLPNYTVSGLPSASTCGAGSMAFVTDATSTTGYTSVAGGGSNKVLVVSDGTNWIIH